MICSICHRPIPDRCQPHYDPEYESLVCTGCLAEDYLILGSYDKDKSINPLDMIYPTDTSCLPHKPLDAYGPSGDVGKVDVKENSSPRPDLEDTGPITWPDWEASEPFNQLNGGLRLWKECLENSEDLNPRYAKIVSDNFWDLLYDDDRLYAHVGEW